MYIKKPNRKLFIDKEYRAWSKIEIKNQSIIWKYMEKIFPSLCRNEKIKQRPNPIFQNKCIGGINFKC